MLYSLEEMRAAHKNGALKELASGFTARVIGDSIYNIHKVKMTCKRPGFEQLSHILEDAYNYHLRGTNEAQARGEHSQPTCLMVQSGCVNNISAGCNWTMAHRWAKAYGEKFNNAWNASGLQGRPEIRSPYARAIGFDFSDNTLLMEYTGDGYC
jgi:hypothetical protein